MLTVTKMDAKKHGLAGTLMAKRRQYLATVKAKDDQQAKQEKIQKLRAETKALLGELAQTDPAYGRFFEAALTGSLLEAPTFPPPKKIVEYHGPNWSRLERSREKLNDVAKASESEEDVETVKAKMAESIERMAEMAGKAGEPSTG